MKERIFALAEALHLTPNAFSVSLGLTRSFAKCLGKTTSAYNVAKILTTYPQVNPYWLLLGEGEMFINQNEFLNKDYKELYENTKSDNDSLRKDNALLRNQLNELMEKNTNLLIRLSGLDLTHNGK